MNETTDKRSLVEQAAEDLFNYAVDREEIKWLLAALSEKGQAKLSKVDYELQLLKIVIVGWSISFFMGGTPQKKAALAELFWQQINIFSKDLSETTGLMIGQDINYFTLVKERLDIYVGAMAGQEEAADPAGVMGSVFADQCGCEGDALTTLTGAKMFHGAVNRVREYLEAVKLR